VNRSPGAGSFMLAEIREQPAALRRLLEQERAVQDAAAALAAVAPRILRLVGHGTSDNAATYGVYAFGLLPGWAAMRDSISLTVYYDAPLDFRDAAVVAISQSGETPDVVEYVQRARARGALTLALTNDESSSLAASAQHVVPLCAGPEQAVAATKTYTNSVAALALLAGHASGRGAELADGVRATADLVEEAIRELEQPAATIATDFTFLGRMFVLGRGLELATAREIALKLQETCRVAADALTATDFAHGPVNAVDPFFPVWAIATVEANLPTVVEAARRAREAGATLVATGAAAGRIDGAAYRLETPQPPSAVLSPLVSVVPGQLFAHALSLARGYDPDRPTRLTKVTRVP
jgi:glutamine---fructose-6-phosphate transaminase (isomerizing)